RVQDGRVVVAVAEPTDQRLAALREVIGDDTVVVVVPRSALDAGLSSELLASRQPGDPGDHSPAQAPPPPVELLPPVSYHAETPPEPLRSFTPAPVHVQPAPAPPPPAGSDDLEWFRDRVQRLE